MDSLHAERAILASVLQKPDLLIDLDIDGRTKLTTFRSPVNRTILSVIVKLYNDGYRVFDRELLYNKTLMYPSEGYDFQQLQLYINSLFNSDISSVNFHKYLDEITEAYLKEETKNILVTNLQALNEKGITTSTSNLVENVQTQLYELRAGINRSDDPRDITKGIGEVIYKRLEGGDSNYGIPTGISLLDDATLGYLPKKFYFVSARPGEGKSAFLLQSAAHAVFFAKRNRTRVLYLDTEISEEEFQMRLIGHIAGVNVLDIMKGDWATDKRTSDNINYAIQLVQNVGGLYHKYIPGFTHGQVINFMKKFVYNEGVGMVIVDYLKMPSGGGDQEERWQKIGDLSRALKDHAGLLDIPVITALQQNKKGIDQSRVTADANAESDDPFKEADGQFALNWKTAKEINEEGIEAGTHRLQILKGRYFRTNWSGINLRFIGYCMRFLPAQMQALEDRPDDATAYVSEEGAHKQLPEAFIDYAGPLRA